MTVPQEKQERLVVKLAPNLISKLYDPQPERGSSNCILQRPFLNKVLSEKMKGETNSEAFKKLFAANASKVTGIEQYEEEHSIEFLANDWRQSGISFYDFIEASKLKIKAKEDNTFTKLKTEQEEKKMRDSNAELKEGDIAILNNDQGFILHCGGELIGRDVEIVKFFSKNDIELAAVEYKGQVYCFRKSMLKPVKKTAMEKMQEKFKDTYFKANDCKDLYEKLLSQGMLRLPTSQDESF